MLTPRKASLRRLAGLVAAAHVLTGCFSYRTVPEPDTVTRPIARQTRVRLHDGTQYTLMNARTTPEGIVFDAARLVPWDSVARFEERRLSVVRTAALATTLVIGAAIVIDALIAVYEIVALVNSLGDGAPSLRASVRTNR